MIKAEILIKVEICPAVKMNIQALQMRILIWRNDICNQSYININDHK